MNSNYYFFRLNSYFGGPVIGNGERDEYQRIKQDFINFWSAQKMVSKVTFMYQPRRFNPFKDVLFKSPGQYDIASAGNSLGSNFLFVSDRMLEIFKTVNVPEYELYPIKYRQKGNIYNGYFVAFLQDYTNYVDFPNSKICYKPYGHEHFIPVKFQSAEDFSAFVRENGSFKYESGATNLGSFRYPEIRFLDFVYNLDLLCIPFMNTTFLMSEELKDVFANEKIPKILFMHWEDQYFQDSVLTLASKDCC